MSTPQPNVPPNAAIVILLTWVKHNKTYLLVATGLIYAVLLACGVDVSTRIDEFFQRPGISEILAVLGITGGFAALKLSFNKELKTVYNDLDDVWTTIETPTKTTTNSTETVTPTTTTSTTSTVVEKVEKPAVISSTPSDTPLGG